MTKVYVIKDLGSTSSNRYYNSWERGNNHYWSTMVNADEFKTKQEAIDKINELEVPYTVIEEVYI